MDKSTKVVLFVFLGVVCLCLFSAIVCGGSIFLTKFLPELKSTLKFSTTTQSDGQKPVTTPIVVSTSTIDLQQADETLEILQNTIIPSADRVTLAENFSGKKDIPLALTSEPVAYKVGDKLDFWTSNMDTNANTQIQATLAYEVKNIYFWVEDGIDVNSRDVKSLVDKFADHIYPTDQEFFGTEWIPGVDNDPYLYILYARNLGGNVAGYESSSDEVLPAAQEFSNVHEMFYMNADVISLSENYSLSVMAHEFQHLIHNYHDPNEETWMNEGFSELATVLNGYSPSGFEYYFAQDADIQLNEWPNDADSRDIHYGSSFLFTDYLLDRFGEETTKAVVADKKNGLDSIDDVFLQEGLTDSLSGKGMTSNQLFMDWAVANYLNDPSVSDGRYSYHNYSGVPSFSSTENISECNTGDQSRTVSQYGTDYIQIDCQGNYTITFNGSSIVDILPTSAIDGTHFMWSNKADVSDMTMTRQFDFSNVNGNIEMMYSMWYDLEEDYDFVYLLSSTDGESWKMVDPPTCTTNNISGNNFGCGYNGTTDGWQQETVDLSQFAGQKIWLRFEYVTDTAVTGEGFAIDTITIPQINYMANFEEDDGGWGTQGFVRIENQIPQTFLVSLIQTSGSTKSVSQYQVAPGEKIAFNVSDRNEDGVTLVVSGSARYSRQKGVYQFKVTK